MKKTKTEKGITLVALIITIIVLLILAVVAINAVQDDGIIEYAKNARDDYQKAQTNESTLLGNYTNYIKENIATVKIITFTIGGDTYQAREGDTWLEWINSEYNTDGFKLYDNSIVTDSNSEFQIIKDASYGADKAERNSDKIVPGFNYYMGFLNETEGF